MTIVELILSLVVFVFFGILQIWYRVWLVKKRRR